MNKKSPKLKNFSLAKTFFIGKKGRNVKEIRHEPMSNHRQALASTKERPPQRFQRVKYEVREKPREQKEENEEELIHHRKIRLQGR